MKILLKNINLFVDIFVGKHGLKINHFGRFSSILTICVFVILVENIQWWIWESPEVMAAFSLCFKKLL